RWCMRWDRISTSGCPPSSRSSASSALPLRGRGSARRSDDRALFASSLRKATERRLAQQETFRFAPASPACLRHATPFVPKGVRSMSDRLLFFPLPREGGEKHG